MCFRVGFFSTPNVSFIENEPFQISVSFEARQGNVERQKEGCRPVYILKSGFYRNALSACNRTEKAYVQVYTHNLRTWVSASHKMADARPPPVFIHTPLVTLIFSLHLIRRTTNTHQHRLTSARTHRKRLYSSSWMWNVRDEMSEERRREKSKRCPRRTSAHAGSPVNVWVVT